MGFLQRLFGTENRADGTVEFEDSLLRAIMGDGTVTRETALQVPTVAGAIDLIGSMISSTPIKLYRDNDGKAEEIRGDERIRLLNDETGDTLNAEQFWKAMVRDYYLGKGGYAYINRKGRRIAGIHYVREKDVAISMGTDPIFKEYSIDVGGRAYHPFEFLKILRNTENGAYGIPVTEESAALIAASYQSILLEQSMAKRGGNKKGFFKSEAKLEQWQMDQLKAAARELYSNNNGNTMVLNKGLSFQECSDTAAEMQLVEHKRSNAEEFAKIFHISAETIGGGKMDSAAVAKLAVIPLMKTIQCALNRDLLLEKEKNILYFAFDTKELLRGDMKERFEAYKTAIDANFMQIDEVRYEEDMPELGLNFIKLGLQDVLYDPQTKTIYTPNTNQTNSMSGNNLQGADGDAVFDSEERAKGNYIQMPNGKMNGSRPSGGNSGLTSGNDDGIMQSSKVPNWSDKEAKEPFNYWELSGNRSDFPARWRPTGFSHETTLAEHFENHGKSVGAKDEADYLQKAKDFLMSPRGKHGDAYVRKNGEVCRYDYDSGLFAKATIKGIIKSFWNLKSDRGETSANSYWEGQKNG